MNITINGKSAEIKMRFKALRALQSMWGLATLNETNARIELTFATGADLDGSIEIIKEFTDNVFTFDEIGEWMFDNVDKLPQLLNAVADDAAQPVADTEGKPIAENPQSPSTGTDSSK